MPKFNVVKSPSPERLAPPRAEPEGLDAFAAGAAVTPPPELVERKQGRALPPNPMPVRFPPDVRDALERLARNDRRSKQQILELVAFPAILAAAERLG